MESFQYECPPMNASNIKFLGLTCSSCSGGIKFTKRNPAIFPVLIQDIPFDGGIGCNGPLGSECSEALPLLFFLFVELKHSVYIIDCLRQNFLVALIGNSKTMQNIHSIPVWISSHN